jgi:hypothetical protein
VRAVDAGRWNRDSDAPRPERSPRLKRSFLFSFLLSFLVSFLVSFRVSLRGSSRDSLTV